MEVKIYTSFLKRSLLIEEMIDGWKVLIDRFYQCDFHTHFQKILYHYNLLSMYAAHLDYVGVL